MEYLIILASVLTITLIKLLITPQRQSIFNIYRTPSNFYWPKVIFMYIVLYLRQLKHTILPKGLTIEELERPQKLSYHDKAVDAVYFNAGNSQGDYLVIGTARRKNRLVDGYIFLKISSSQLGVLETPKVPCTALYKSEENDEYGAEGITVTPIVPMRKWKIVYNGKLKKTEDPRQSYNVSINAEWSSDLPYFSFDTDLDPLATAKTIALEPWSIEFFRTLKAEYQLHYEQFGELNGKVEIEGKEYDLRMNSLRDHSFGIKRDWAIIHRYGVHYINAENGDRFAVIKISVPILFSNTTIGFVYLAKDKKIYPLRSCDLELYQHGENGTPPTDYAFSFVAGGQYYTMQINVTDSPFFYTSKDWECKIIERLCTAEINGKKGWGISQWQYRNIMGRSISATSSKANV